MSNQLWANQPRPERLKIETPTEGVIRFNDSETGQWIHVVFTSGPGKPWFFIAPPLFGWTASERINFNESKHFVKGEGIAQRDVYHYVTKDHAAALRAGLTVHRSAFSSTPHEFELSPEPGFEEVFYFVMPPGAKAIVEGEGMWPNGERVDAAWPVRNGQFLQVCMGHHRVCALPDEDGRVPKMAYIWCYLALPGRGWEKD